MPVAPASDDLILIPVFDDWASLALLLPQVDESLAADSRAVSVILVDDCSILPPDGLVGEAPLSAIQSIDVLSLTRNVGHQRALAIGLSYIANHRPCRSVVVMDADGEDLPSDVPRLLAAREADGAGRIVFAQRTRRSEGVVFAVFYHLYRIAHWAMTGIRVEVGNFSVVPYASVRKLAVVSEMWNHYAAAVVHARLPFALLPTVRGTRLAGKSAMNFVSLVGHGLSAMSVFADRIGVRMLAVTGGLIVLLVLAVAGILGVRLFTDLAIPGWTTVALGFVAVLLTQAALLAVVFTFMIQGGRERSSFIPGREYEPFIDSVSRIWPRPSGG